MTKWWKEAVIYQIYPRSFQDTSGNGIGDLPGIIQRLDYLAWLGIDAIWISPVYPSPMADFGYDISDYTGIHALFGTISHMQELIQKAHQHGLKVILDFVPNHSSNRHPWFLESRRSRDNPKRDWYIWRDPAPDGGPPNNWLSRFDGKSAWEFDAGTGQYYLHSFLKEQPDLNWRNPALRAAMLDVLRFWFDQGVDGSRVDVSYRVMKDTAFQDNPVNPLWRAGMDPHKRLVERFSKNIPDIHLFNRWLRQVADEYGDRVLIGEINLPLPGLVAHYGKNDEFHLPFNFRLIYESWSAEHVRRLAEEYENLLPQEACPNWVLGNHDQPRFASRVGRGQARVGMMLLLTLRGTPTVYYGDELGMTDVAIPAKRVQDPWELLTPGLGLGRDPERTPMQWDDSPNAGFCPPDVEPWLPLAPDHREVNVATAKQMPGSMLRLTREILSYRRALPALRRGAFRSLPAPDGVFAFVRDFEGEQCLIVLNFTDEIRYWKLPDEYPEHYHLLVSTYIDTLDAAGRQLRLRPDEGLLLKV